MKLYLTILMLIGSFTVFAQSVKQITVNNIQERKGNILSVKIASQKLGGLDGNDPVITFQVTAIAGASEKFTHIEAFGGQTSLSDQLNSTDKYYKILTSAKDGGMTVGFGEKQNFIFAETFSAPIAGFGVIYHLSFDIGMRRGFNRYALYKLDLSNRGRATLTFVKNYSHVEGNTVEY